MPNRIIEKYLDTILRSQLTAFGIPDAIIDTITVEVQTQMLSCMFHWENTEFKKAILIVGEEEGSFYLPKADADIRNFVVVTLRNSPLESIHADSYIGKRLSSGNLKALTSGAIEYFKDVDFSSASGRKEAFDNDKYSGLANKYPISWRALTELANSAKQILEYTPLAISVKPNLNILKPKQAVNGLFFNDNQSKMMHVVYDKIKI